MKIKPRFWKLSQGTKDFNLAELFGSIREGLVYVHKNTKGKAISKTTQGQNFFESPVGDYFYLTHGNNRIYLLGQFSGPPNILSAKAGGWLDRPFRHIRSSISMDPYAGQKKWWTPNENSTFVAVPDGELKLFEDWILVPYFELKLSDFDI
jgi:hypothetical protein